MKKEDKEEFEKSELIKSIAIEFAPSIIRSMINVCLSDKSPPSTRVQAAQLILDRGFGKAKQAVEHSVDKGSFIDLLRGIEEVKKVKNEDPPAKILQLVSGDNGGGNNEKV